MKRNTIVLLAVFLLTGCWAVQRVETKRLTSPDGKVDAVMVRSDAGATTPYTFSLYIVPSGGDPEKAEAPVFVADHVDALDFRWSGARLLEIQYDKARVFQFTNFWNHRDVDNFEYEVKITETEQHARQVSPEAAPSASPDEPSA